MTLSKLIFYLLYGLNSLTLLLALITIYSNLTTYKLYNRSTENIIFTLAAIILTIGIFIAHNKAFKYDVFLYGNIIFIASWIAALIVIIIGLLEFNGPNSWQ